MSLNTSDRIYIAGHRGMVGSAILRKLRSNQFQNILTAERNELDLSKVQDVNDWFKNNKPDVVILAAAKVGGILANHNYPVEFLLENMKIQNNLIETSWNMGIKKLLFLGSSCIYPKYAEQPIKEEALLTGELEATNQWYAIAKISGLKLCEALRRQFEFDSISLMPTNLYGPGDNYHPTNSHVLPALIRRFYEATLKHKKSVTCWGSGLCRREFLHVDDLADACLFVLNKWDCNENKIINSASGEILNHLNVGTGIDLTIRDLANMVASACKYDGKINWDTSKPDGTPRKLLDVSRINNLGWKAKIDLKEGIQSTVNNYINNF